LAQFSATMSSFTGIAKSCCRCSSGWHAICLRYSSTEGQHLTETYRRADLSAIPELVVDELQYTTRDTSYSQIKKSWWISNGGHTTQRRQMQVVQIK